MSVVHGDECFCDCHRHEGMVHCIPCCSGQCSCGEFVKDVKAHEARTGHKFNYYLPPLSPGQRTTEPPA